LAHRLRRFFSRLFLCATKIGARERSCWSLFFLRYALFSAAITSKILFGKALWTACPVINNNLFNERI
jgi:hypothetical protein